MNKGWSKRGILIVAGVAAAIFIAGTIAGYMDCVNGSKYCKTAQQGTSSSP